MAEIKQEKEQNTNTTVSKVNKLPKENTTVKTSAETIKTSGETKDVTLLRKSGAHYDKSKKQIWEKKSGGFRRDEKEGKGTWRGRARKDRRSKSSFGFNNALNEFSEKVINISRVTKVVKGGRRFSFAAFVVVGDKKGRVGFGHGKANEVPDSIKKAIKDAKNHLINVPIYNKITVPHEIHAKFLASKVLLKPAPKGKGIVASNTVRAVVELAGYTDIYTKTYGSRSKANIVRATLKALQALRTPEQIAEIRGKEVKDLL